MQKLRVGVSGGLPVKVIEVISLLVVRYNYIYSIYNIILYIYISISYIIYHCISFLRPVRIWTLTSALVSILHGISNEALDSSIFPVFVTGAWGVSL